MKEAAGGFILGVAALILVAAMLGSHPVQKSDEGRKPITDLQMDALRARFPDVELDTKYRAKFCRNDVWWYFYANHDAMPSNNGCW